MSASRPIPLRLDPAALRNAAASVARAVVALAIADRVASGDRVSACARHLVSPLRLPIDVVLGSIVRYRSH